MNPIEIIVVCTALMCPPDFTAIAVPLGPGQTFESQHMSQPGGWLRPWCFINPSRFRGPGRGGYIRVVDWTDVTIKVEVTKGVRACRSKAVL